MVASVKTIPGADCARLIKEGLPVTLVDVRTPVEFARVHAAGAKSMPLDSLDPRAVDALRRAPGEAIYVICQSGGRSAKACQKLGDAGQENVYSVEGGTMAWEKGGFPVVRGSVKVISLERQVRIVAGSLILLGVALGWFAHPVFYGLSAFVGAGLLFAGVTDYCGMGMLLAKMPWNQIAKG